MQDKIWFNNIDTCILYDFNTTKGQGQVSSSLCEPSKHHVAHGAGATVWCLHPASNQSPGPPPYAWWRTPTQNWWHHALGKPHPDSQDTTIDHDHDLMTNKSDPDWPRFVWQHTRVFVELIWYSNLSMYEWKLRCYGSDSCSFKFDRTQKLKS